MENFWTRNYPAEVCMQHDFPRFASLSEVFEESFNRFPDRDAYLMMGKSMTFGELDAWSRDFAAFLQSVGLKKGDRLAIMLPNVLQFPIVFAAALRAGVIVVNVNPLYTARELEHQLKDSGAKAIVVLENFAATLESVIARVSVDHIVVASVGEMFGFAKRQAVNFALRHVKRTVPRYGLLGHVKFREALSIGRRVEFERPNINEEDVAILQYTGGTTGRSKGAVLLNKSVLASLQSLEAWMRPSVSRPPGRSHGIFVCALPL